MHPVDSVDIAEALADFTSNDQQRSQLKAIMQIHTTEPNKALIQLLTLLHDIINKNNTHSDSANRWLTSLLTQKDLRNCLIQLFINIQKKKNIDVAKRGFTCLFQSKANWNHMDAWTTCLQQYSAFIPIEHSTFAQLMLNTKCILKRSSLAKHENNLQTFLQCRQADFVLLITTSRDANKPGPIVIIAHGLLYPESLFPRFAATIRQQPHEKTEEKTEHSLKIKLDIIRQLNLSYQYADKHYFRHFKLTEAQPPSSSFFKPSNSSLTNIISTHCATGFKRLPPDQDFLRFLDRRLTGIKNFSRYTSTTIRIVDSSIKDFNYVTKNLDTLGLLTPSIRANPYLMEILHCMMATIEAHSTYSKDKKTCLKMYRLSFKHIIYTMINHPEQNEKIFSSLYGMYQQKGYMPHNAWYDVTSKILNLKTVVADNFSV